MTIPTAYILYGVIALAAFLLIEGAYYFFADNGNEQKRVNRRLQMLSSGEDPMVVLDKLKRVREENWEKFGHFGKILVQFQKTISQAGVTISVARCIVIMVSSSFFVSLVLLLFLLRKTTVEITPSVLFSIFIASLFVGFGLPIAGLFRKRLKRLKKFSEQLPDAIDMMVRSLRAGHPVNVAIGLTAREMMDPIGTEFGIVVDEMTYGLHLRDALENVRKRIDLPEFDYLVVAISIQHDTGGNLAEVLHGLSSVMRARFQMFRKIRALAAEARFSAKVLSVLPIVFGGFLLIVKPEYYLSQSDDALFLPILGIGFILQIIGIIVMQKLINFRV